MMEHFFRAEDVRAATTGRWPAVLVSMGVPAEALQGGHTRCPGCGGKDRFRFDDRDGSGSWLCSQGGGGLIAGDGIDLIAHVRGLDWKEACNAIGAVVCPERAVRCGSGLPRPAAGVEMPAPEPVERDVSGYLPYDEGALRRFFRPDLAADGEWFARRSPVDPSGVGPGVFLDAIFEPGEKVLIFERQESQGQFIHWVGRGSFRLSSKPGVKAVPSVLPRGGREGVWYLCQPVDGLWHPNPRGKETKNGELPLSRRAMEAVTGWRHLVLESDEAPEGLWMNLLAQLPLPICAIYGSGKRSIHALVRVRAESKVEWDAVKRTLAPLLTRLGADGGALSAVRLTRLPGCYRNGVAQKLFYLNPAPDPGLPICAMGEIR